MKISKQREKENGEVFTPKELIGEMLLKIDEDVWRDPTKTFLEPSCGDGNILCEIFIYRIAYGIDPLVALETLYGVELMDDNVEIARQRLWQLYADAGGSDVIASGKILNTNIVCTNSLEYDFEFNKEVGTTRFKPYFEYEERE